MNPKVKEKDKETPVEEQERVPIHESEEEPIEEAAPEVVFLEEGKVKEILEASKMPKAAQEKLIQEKYLDAEAVKAAVITEREYLKSLYPDAGLPFEMGESQPPESEAYQPKTLEEVEKERTALFEQFGIAIGI